MGIINQEFMDARNSDHDIHPLMSEFFSGESMEVLENFGYNAPHILNEYACRLEDEFLKLINTSQLAKRYCIQYLSSLPEGLYNLTEQITDSTVTHLHNATPDEMARYAEQVWIDASPPVFVAVLQVAH
jgi:hypothetical protein